MPVKYKPTQSVVQRGSKKVVTTHYYMKTQSLNELLQCYNNDNTKPKLRQKVKNELIRRQRLGLVKIVTKDETGNISEFKQGVLQMDINFIKEYIKGRLGELSSLDGAVIVGISLGAILLAPIVKYLAWAGLVYGAYRIFKADS